MDSESEWGPAFRLGGEIQNVTFGAWSRALRTGDQFKRNTRAAPQPPLTQQGEQAAQARSLPYTSPPMCLRFNTRGVQALKIG